MQLLFSIILTFLIAFRVDAQNYFYNSQQFGLNGTMLGGAVIAGNDDLSMAYYNSAALHLAKPKANISLIQPRLDKFGFENFFGKEVN